MKPGDWVWTDGYDDEDATRALVVATSAHREVVKRADANRIIAEEGYVHTRDVTWRSVLVRDRDELGDECEFHEHGTGRRWVEVALCRRKDDDETCFRCVHSVPGGYWEQRRNQVICRRYPPTPGVFGEGSATGVFPRVHIGDRCGEFKAPLCHEEC